MQPILTVRGLRSEFVSEGRVSRAVDGIDLDVQAGETVGLVGETGCGKSATALSILGLIPSPPGKVTAAQLRFEGSELLGLDAASSAGSAAPGSR